MPCGRYRDIRRRHSPYRDCPPFLIISLSSSHPISFSRPTPSPRLSLVCLLDLVPRPPGVGRADERTVCGRRLGARLLASHHAVSLTPLIARSLLPPHAMMSSPPPPSWPRCHRSSRHRADTAPAYHRASVLAALCPFPVPYPNRSQPCLLRSRHPSHRPMSSRPPHPPACFVIAHDAHPTLAGHALPA